MDGDDYDLIFLERNLSNQIAFFATSLDPKKPDQNRLRQAVWQRFELKDWERFNDADRRRRLEKIYTSENMAELNTLLSDTRDHFQTRYGKTLMRSLELKAYLKLLSALLSISLGASIVSFEIYRRKTAQTLATPPKTL